MKQASFNQLWVKFIHR